MNYFDIFRIDYEDLKIIADQPQAIITRAVKNESGYVGEIVLLGEYPERASNILFYHENDFETEQDARNDLNQIIETVTRASENTKKSETLRETNLPE